VNAYEEMNRELKLRAESALYIVRMVVVAIAVLS
jgi:hypothetical protein